MFRVEDKQSLGIIIAIISVICALSIAFFTRLEMEQCCFFVMLAGIDGLLIILIFFSNYFFNRRTDLGTYQKYRKYYDNLNLSFYTKKFKKTVTITDIDGTATIRIHHKLKNISSSPFEYIGKTLKFDGEFIYNNFELKVDKKKYDWYTLNREYGPFEVKSTELEEYYKKVFFKIPFKNQLRPKKTCSINLKYTLQGVFSDAFIDKDQSASYILYPTDKIKTKIILDGLDNFKLLYRDIDIEIINNVSKDQTEKARFLNDIDLMPKGSETKELIWKYDNPKVGNRYSLYFSCLQDIKKGFIDGIKKNVMEEIKKDSKKKIDETQIKDDILKDLDKDKVNELKKKKIDKIKKIIIDDLQQKNVLKKLVEDITSKASKDKIINEIDQELSKKFFTDEDIDDIRKNIFGEINKSEIREEYIEIIKEEIINSLRLEMRDYFKKKIINEIKTPEK